MIGKPSPITAVLMLCAVVLSGCQSPVRSSAGTLDDRRTGLVTDAAGQGCRTDTPNAASGGPDALYAEMNACVRAQQLDRAVFLYALAGSYTWFDAERVATQYAKTAHGKRLGEALAQLSEKQVTQLWDHIRATMQEVGKRQVICEKVRTIGMPTHSTDYLRLDKSALGGSKPGERHHWDRAVDNYLMCK